MNGYVWKLTPQPSVEKNKEWLLDRLAKNRGLTTAKKLQEFLNPTLEQILGAKLTDTKKAISRIQKALKNNEKIIVYSDYDADGICATAIMWETLHDLGADIMPYVPHRIKEGYGLFTPSIRQLAKKGVTLIITVDHGVTAVSQIEAAKEAGIDVIITDHHVLPKELPKAFALVHTTDLCGAGVSWRFCWDLVGEIKASYKDTLLEKLELAAIATIADLVPLLGANRAIVKIGLEKLTKTSRPGIKSLIRDSGIRSEITTYEIGHVIAPRINAMGRIEHGLDSLRLLCAKSQKQADSLAKLLSKTNTKRQGLTTSAIENAKTLVNLDHLVHVVTHHSWHEGVIGLVASRLVETYHKPAVVIARGETYSKGSARSIAGFNIVEAIRESSEYLVDGGGHPMAAGFTIKTEYIEAFTNKINLYAKTRITEELMTPLLNIECVLEPKDISASTLSVICKFEPYGVANPQPLFLTRNLQVEDIRSVGQENKHLKMQVNGHSTIGFNIGQIASDIRPGYLVDLVYTLEENHYNGDSSPQINIKDLVINGVNES